MLSVDTNVIILLLSCQQAWNSGVLVQEEADPAAEAAGGKRKRTGKAGAKSKKVKAEVKSPTQQQLPLIKGDLRGYQLKGTPPAFAYSLSPTLCGSCWGPSAQRQLGSSCLAAPRDSGTAVGVCSCGWAARRAGSRQLLEHTSIAPGSALGLDACCLPARLSWQAVPRLGSFVVPAAALAGSSRSHVN